MIKRPESFASGETRDSALRQKLGPAIESTVQFLYKYAPWMTPDTITLIGTVSVAAGSAMAIHDQSQPQSDQRPLVGLLTTALGELTDGIDGTAARYRREVLNINSDPVRGMFVDVISDRTQEFVMSLARAISARRRGDQWGTFAAVVSAITNTLPSLFRARAERRGYTVEENALGSRLGRAILSTVALHFPRTREIPLQPVIDTVMSIANVSLAISRARVPHNGNLNNASSTVQELGEKREAALTAFTVLSVAGALVAYGAIQKTKRSR